jgi:hypothetical protein
MQVSAGVTALRDAPQPDAQMVTQALYGETVTLLEERGDFGLVQMQRDRYIGWAQLEALATPVFEATHKVVALRTHIYSGAHLKTAPHFMASMGSLLTLEGGDGDFRRTARGGFVPRQHIVEVEQFQDDPAGVAERFLGAPYLWGGCESLGLDCTGLTRAAFQACDVILPRDSDMQFAWSGAPVEGWSDPGALERGDMVFWKGHVGIMLDDATLLHANAYHMAVAAEPLGGAIERIAKIYGEPTGARRINVLEERGRTPAWLTA